jgi:uncharacterized protein (DUF952 family)
MVAKPSIASLAHTTCQPARRRLTPPTMTLVYKISLRKAWAAAAAAGVYTGAPVDLADGYIHLSAAHQARETAARHFAGQADLVLATVDAAVLGEALRWEASRGGDLFPHLYGPLPMPAVRSVVDLPLGQDGRHVFPDEVR